MPAQKGATHALHGVAARTTPGRRGAAYGRAKGDVMRRLIPALLLAFAWVAPVCAADLPFKVLSTGHVKGQAQAGQSEARDAKALAEIWSKLGLKGPAPKVNFKQRMVVSWV